MKLYSTRNKNKFVSFEQAVLKGLADDGGLFMPEKIPEMVCIHLPNTSGHLPEHGENNSVSVQAKQEHAKTYKLTQTLEKYEQPKQTYNMKRETVCKSTEHWLPTINEP